MLLYMFLHSNKDVIILDALCHQVKVAYVTLGLEKEKPVKKIQLHVYWIPNGTFGICATVPTGDPTAGSQGPGAPMTVKTG